MGEQKLISLREAENMIKDQNRTRTNQTSVNYIIAGAESVEHLDLDKLLSGEQNLERTIGTISNLDLRESGLLLKVDEINNTQLNSMHGSSEIRSMSNSRIENMHDSSLIYFMNQSIIGNMHDLSGIRLAGPESEIHNMYDSSMIHNLFNSTVKNMHGSSHILRIDSLSTVENCNRINNP